MSNAALSALTPSLPTAARTQLGHERHRRDRARRHAHGRSRPYKRLGPRPAHVLGSNYFHYVRDPWGSFAEYSADIDYVPATCDWKGGDQPGEDAFYAWGPNVPEDFVRNHEAT